MPRPLDELNKKRSAPPDFWMKTSRLISVCGWTVFGAAIIFVGLAKPTTETFFDRRNNIYVRQMWNMQQVDYIFQLTVLTFALGALGTALTLWRRQVAGQEVQYNLPLMMLVGLGGVFTYWWYF